MRLLEQRRALARYYVEHHGWRPSEAAMHFSQMRESRVKKLAASLKVLEAAADAAVTKALSKAKDGLPS